MYTYAFNITSDSLYQNCPNFKYWIWQSSWF